MNPLQSLLNIADTSKNIVQKKAQNTQAVARKELGTLSSVADVSANVARKNAQEKANPIGLMANEKIQNLANIPKMSLSNNPFKFENLLGQEQGGIPNLGFTQMGTQPVNMNVQPSPMDSITRDAQMVRDDAVSRQNIADDKVLNLMNTYTLNRDELFDLGAFKRKELEEAGEDTAGLDDIDLAQFALDTAPEEEKKGLVREGILGSLQGAGIEGTERQLQSMGREQSGQQSVLSTKLQDVGSVAGYGADLIGDAFMGTLKGAGNVIDYITQGGASEVATAVGEKIKGTQFYNDTVGEGLNKLGQGMEQYNERKQANPVEGANVDALLNIVDIGSMFVGGGAVKKAGQEAIESGVGKTIKEGLETGIQKGIKAVGDIKAPKISPSGMVDDTTDYIAKKIVGTATPQDKLFKAQSPTLNVLNKNRDFKTLRNQSDTANDLIVKAGHKPVDTDTRRIAHEKTMQSKWKEIESKIENKKDLMVDQKQFASILDETIRDAKKSGLVKNLSDITALKKEADAMRKQGFIDLPSLEKKKQYINGIINNWGDSAIGDVYKNGMKKVTRAIGEVEDKALAKIPGEFSNLKKEFGALKSTYEDVLKADLRNQRSKGLNLLESYSRIEGIGDILGGTIGIFTRGAEGAKDIVKGAGKVLLGKSLKKATDVDFLIKEGFENLSPKLQNDIKNMVGDISTIVPNSMGSKQIQIKPTAKDIVKKVEAKKVLDKAKSKTILNNIDNKKVAQNPTEALKSKIKSVQSDTLVSKSDSMSKDLQPLYEEAKKYKSARDMYNQLPPKERALFDEEGIYSLKHFEDFYKKNVLSKEGLSMYRGQKNSGSDISYNDTNFQGDTDGGVFFTPNKDTAGKYGSNIIEIKSNKLNTVSEYEVRKLQKMASEQVKKDLKNGIKSKDIIEQMALGRPKAFAQYTKKPFIETGDMFGEKGEMIYYKGIK